MLRTRLFTLFTGYTIFRTAVCGRKAQVVYKLARNILHFLENLDNKDFFSLFYQELLIYLFQKL